MRKYLVILVLILGGIQAMAYTPLQRRIYLFGFATSFTDSVAYMTDVQVLDSAYVHPNGFLADRTMYGAQLDYYMQNTLKLQNMTCVVFFSKSKSKLEKKYLKIKKKYAAEHAVTLSQLGRDAFTFKLEEWIDPDATASTSVVPTAAQTATAAGGNGAATSSSGRAAGGPPRKR